MSWEDETRTGGSRIKSAWSLKRQIRLLGMILVASVITGGIIAVEYIRHTEVVQVVEAERDLRTAAERLRARYQESLATYVKSDVGPADRARNDQWLRSLTQQVLANFTGVEGGFYDTRSKAFLGYAYPTYKGSGPKIDVPPAEQGSILKVIKAAHGSSGVAFLRVDARDDVLLFYALALRMPNSPVDTVWVMHRLVGIKNTFARIEILGLGILLVLSGSAIAVAWILTLRLESGVATLEAALARMEARLDTAVPQTGVRELDRIGDAISHLAAALERNQKRRDELEQRLRQADRLAALGRLVAGVAHEVRNPLASIKLKLDLARKYPDTAERIDKVFELVSAEIERVDRIVSRLLTLGKASKASASPTDLYSFLHSRLRAHQPRAQAKGASLELKLASPVDGQVMVDQDRLGQIVDNLVINAIEAVSPGCGLVVVEAGRTETGTLLIRVCDNGPGIPAHVRERLFEPFVTGKEHGTGLGLFVSAELARAMGGELRYKDACGDGAAVAADKKFPTGATFELILPC